MHASQCTMASKLTFDPLEHPQDRVTLRTVEGDAPLTWAEDQGASGHVTPDEGVPPFWLGQQDVVLLTQQILWKEDDLHAQIGA